MKNKTKFKENYLKITRLNYLLFKLIFKDSKIYLVSILIPMILSLLLYWIWGTLSTSIIYTPQMFGFISIGCISTAFYISILINDWKSTNFLKQLRTSGTSFLFLISTLFLIVIFFSLISVFFSLILAIVITKLVYAFPISFSVFEISDWCIWFYYFIAIIFISMVTLISFILISNISKNNYIIIVLNVLLLVFFILFSDLSIIPYVTSKSTVISILQYLNPLKFSLLIIFMFTSYQFLDNYGVQQIISTNGTQNIYISFSNILIPILILLFFIVFTIIYLKYKFILGIKN